MKPMTISEVKNCFRGKMSLLVDHLKDPYSVRKYIYRLERREIIYQFMEDKGHGYSVYAITP